MELKGRITVFSILGCPHCMRAKNTLRELNLPFSDVRLDLYPQIKDYVLEKCGGKRTVPQLFFNEEHIGGNDDFQSLVADKVKLNAYIEKLKTTSLPDGVLVLPDPSTAVKEADPFSFQCEPDEYFLLVNEMRQENVVRRHSGGLFKKYDDSFKGCDFIAWVKNKLGLDDDAKALEMGQNLLDRNFARPVKSPGSFCGGTELYILTDTNEDVEALNSGPISDCVPKKVGEIGQALRKMTLKLYSVFLSSDGKFFNPFGKDDPRLKVALECHEPLIHFALVCGAKSCPPIKTYSTENVNSELTMAAKSFLESEESCSVDLAKRTVHLSAIFKWYAIDFGKDKKEQLKFIADLMDAGKKKDDLNQLIESSNYKVNYLSYDWTVNSK